MLKLGRKARSASEVAVVRRVVSRLDRGLVLCDDHDRRG